MDKRISTALIGTRDMLVAGAITLPVAIPLIAIIWVRTPAPDPDIARSTQVLDAVGWVMPALLIVLNLGFLVAGWWFRRSRPVEGWDRTGRPNPSWLDTIPAGIGLGIGGLLLQMVLTAITVVGLGLETQQDNPLRTLAAAGGMNIALLLVLGCIVAPIGEELFFRGHLFRWSADRCGTTYGYMLSASLFTLGHALPAGMPAHFAVAVIYAQAYRRWRTLSVPMVAHATNNSIAFGIAIFAARMTA